MEGARLTVDLSRVEKLLSLGLSGKGRCRENRKPRASAWGWVWGLLGSRPVSLREGGIRILLSISGLN